MSLRLYRTLVVGCALSWLLLGMHAPIVHDIMDHGAVPSWPLAAAIGLLVASAAGSLWFLLRRGEERLVARRRTH